MSSAVASSLCDAALAHHVDAQRRVRQERGDVHRERAPVERVEVLGERLPLPLDALVQRGAGDVLHAFHQLDEAFVLVGAHRREADPAVADHDRGDAVARRRIQDRVPGRLTVVVRVDVDEAGRDDAPGRVDDLACVAVDVLADGDDHAVADGDVTHEPGTTGAVDDRPTGDLQLEHATSVPTPRASGPGDQVVSAARLSSAGAVLTTSDVNAASTSGSSRWSAAPRAGLRRHWSVHGPRSGSAPRATRPLIPA